MLSMVKNWIDVENIQTSILKINERRKQGYAIHPSPSPQASDMFYVCETYFQTRISIDNKYNI